MTAPAAWEFAFLLPAEVRQLAPAQKAQAIYRAAQAEMTQRLWQSAMGGDDMEGSTPLGQTGRFSVPGDAMFSLDTLLSLLSAGDADGVARHTATSGACDARSVTTAATDAGPASHGDVFLQDVDTGVRGGRADDPNARYRPVLAEAAARTGVRPEAIAAIINAEAARNRDGSWNPHSRNPRSTAAGLGQFLNSSWIAMAERPGSALHGVAQAQGWLDPRGRIMSGARSALLALRADAALSIHAVADYARDNIARLQASGVVTGADLHSQARAAYVGHHLGPGDAVRFYRGTLDADRARALLTAQIGAASASRHIAQAGDPVLAHRRWLMGYVARAVDTSGQGA